jgi:DNA polymerase elongation subunit (family B)
LASHSPTSGTYAYSQREGLRLILRESGRDIELDAPFKPYFFVKRGHERVVEYYAKRRGISVHIEPTDLKTLDGHLVSKVEVDHPQYVAALRDAMVIPSYEADIPYVRRVMIDMDWKTSQVYRRLYYDIEVKDGAIVCIAVGSESGSVEVLTGSERDILEAFVEASQSVDMCIGYNSEAYDVPVLRRRLREHKLELPKMPRWYDLLQSLKWIYRMLPSWSLEYVGRHLLGIERVHTDKPFSQLTLQEIYERCRRDVEITRELDRKLGLSDLDILKAHISYTFPDEVYYISRCIDALLLRRARELGYVLPNKPVKPETQQHSGAFVAQPPEPLRIYRNVLFLDCVSMYPSIIISYKISPDPERRLYPDVLSRLMSERKRYKQLYRETRDPRYDLLQQAHKILANAFYGVFNAPGFRIQRPDLGDEVARRGREVVTSLYRFYSSLGYNVIYADTDSVALSDITPDESVFSMLAEAGTRHVKESLGADIQVEAKKFYSKLYFPRRASDESAAKKRYAGYVVWTSDEGWLERPELDVVGIEIVRTDYPPAAQTFQRALIEGFLSGKSRLELQRLVLDFKKALFSGLLSPEDLALSKSVTKSEYKVNPPHIRAAKKLQEAGIPVNVGDKIRFVWTKWGPLPLELSRGAPLDYRYYWEHIFLPIVERTLGLRGESSLEAWLSGVTE